MSPRRARATIDAWARKTPRCGSPCLTCAIGVLGTICCALPLALVMACVRTAAPKASPGDGPEGYAK